MIGIFRDHVAPLDFAENTDMAKDLDYKTGLNFWGLFFWEKSPSYRRINMVDSSNIQCGGSIQSEMGS